MRPNHLLNLLPRLGVWLPNSGIYTFYFLGLIRFVAGASAMPDVKFTCMQKSLLATELG